MAVQKQLHTIEDFVAFTEQPENADRLFELINGEIVEKMPGRASNSQIHDILGFLVRLFCRENHLPCYTASADGAFQVLQHTFAPDFAYRTTPFTGAYPEPEPPLWVVEIISPTDEPGKVRAKRMLYLQAGILYWELYPEDQGIDVYAPGQPMRTYRAGDVIDLGDLIPGFSIEVNVLFADL